MDLYAVCSAFAASLLCLVVVQRLMPAYCFRINRLVVVRLGLDRTLSVISPVFFVFLWPRFALHHSRARTARAAEVEPCRCCWRVQWRCCWHSCQSVSGPGGAADFTAEEAVIWVTECAGRADPWRLIHVSIVDSAYGD